MMRAFTSMKFFSPLSSLLLLVSLLSACNPSKPVVVPKRKTTDPTGVVKEVNRLSLVHSPFLKRHETDLVDWYPWGEEAFARAAEENKMVMVCIGYSSCPWTLKMQRETYADAQIAGYLNKHFINILVDREERPDLNNAYMRYAYLRNRQSGWPLHVWLTPKGLPWHTAVYLPRLSTNSSPGFQTTVEHVVNDWEDPAYVNREALYRVEGSKMGVLPPMGIDKKGQPILSPQPALGYRQQLEQLQMGDKESKLELSALELAFDKLNAAFDPAYGGFSGAPKFHQGTSIEWLLEYASLRKATAYGRSERAQLMARVSLDKLAAGALQDQLGGGFHRYGIDAHWTVPQFEKMLYDQGYLVQAFLHAAAVTGKTSFLATAKRTLDYVEAELNHPAGGFYCAENCFSSLKPSDQEGGYYLWRKEEIDQIVGPESAAVLQRVYDLTDKGNLPVEVLNLQTERFPNQNILRMAHSLAEAAQALSLPEAQVDQLFQSGNAKLLAARQLRPRPLRDEKVLPAWNAVVISAFLQGASQLQSPAYLQRALKAAEFTYNTFLKADYSRPRFAEDYALLIKAMLDAYETTGDPKWLENGVSLQARMDRELWDGVLGGYWDGPADPNLFAPLKSCDEACEFAPNATAASNLVRLARLLGELRYLTSNGPNPQPSASATLNAFVGETTATAIGAATPPGPATHVRVLSAYAQYSLPGCQFIICGKLGSPEVQAFQAVLLAHFRPNSYLLYLDGGPSETYLKAHNRELAGLKLASGKPLVVLARNYHKEQSFANPADLKAFLDQEY